MNPTQAYWNAIAQGNVERDTLDELNAKRIDHELSESAQRSLRIGHLQAVFEVEHAQHHFSGRGE